MKFIFELDQEVKLRMSGEKGKVIGRGEYSHSENTYFVRYVSGDGRQVDSWLSESEIQAATD